MSHRLTATGIVVSGAVAAMLLGPNGPLGDFWRPIAMEPAPAGAQLAGLIGSRLVEAIGFGAALAILAVGRRLFVKLTRTPGTATTAQLAAAWLIGSWWPHSALHMHFGLRADALAGLELVFHAGSIVAFALLLWALMPVQPRAVPEP
ncbi:MAG: hypothetical protein ACRDT4_00680 [Micromonosporaceae bacterium]